MALKKVVKKVVTETAEAVAEANGEDRKTIADLTEAVNDDPRNIRRWLRAQGVEKVESRYSWDEDEFNSLVDRYLNKPKVARGRPKSEVEEEAEEEVEEVVEAPKPKTKIKRKVAAAA